MPMKYRNTKTGAVIDTTSKLSGNWEPADKLPAPGKPKPVKENKEKRDEKK